MSIFLNEALKQLALSLFHLFQGHEAPVCFIKCKRLPLINEAVVMAIPCDQVQLRIGGQSDHALNVGWFCCVVNQIKANRVAPLFSSTMAPVAVCDCPIKFGLSGFRQIKFGVDMAEWHE